MVDADACPVKDEVYKVAFRHEVPVSIVSNSIMRIPVHPLVERVVVSDGFDAADDWIAEHADGGSIVITADILLADRCLKSGAAVIAPTGRNFTTRIRTLLIWVSPRIALPAGRPPLLSASCAPRRLS